METVKLAFVVIYEYKFYVEEEMENKDKDEDDDDNQHHSFKSFKFANNANLSVEH